MVKIGDLVKWDAGSKGMMGGKVTGGEKGNRWKIEKGGKTFYILKDKVKKGVVKKVKSAVAPKKDKTIIRGGKVIQFSKKDEKLRQELIAKNNEKDKNMTLAGRTRQRYKTIDELLSALRTIYKKWDVSRFKISQGGYLSEKDGKEVGVEAREMKNGKQKGNLQIKAFRVLTDEEMEQLRRPTLHGRPRPQTPTDRSRLMRGTVMMTGIFAKPRTEIE